MSTKQAIRLFLVTAFFLFGVSLFFILGYFLGFDILLGHTGNDAPNAFTFTTWLDEYFPRVPFWFPLQGVGVSFTQGYNILAFLLVVILKRLTGFSLLEVFNFFLFLGPILTGLTIYLWVWWRWRSQVMALLAGVFYLLMPLTWIFITEWGFYNEVFVYFLIPLVLVFFDYYLEERKYRTLFATSLLFSMTILVHFPAGTFLAILLSFYGLVYPFLNTKGERIKSSIRGMGAILIIGLVVFLLTLFWLYPFLSYNQLASRGMVVGLMSHEEVANMIFPPASFLGLARIPEEAFQYSMRNAVVPPLIWLLALTGFLLGFFKSKKIFVLGLFLLLELVYFFNLNAVYWVAQRLPFLTNFLSLRTYLFHARFILPVMAAYGLVEAINLVILPFKKWLKGSVSYFTGFLSLLLATWLIFLFASFPVLKGRTLNYGPEFAGENIETVWQKRNQINWLKLSDKNYFYQLFDDKKAPSTSMETANWLMGKLPQTDNLRIDISGKLGGLTQQINIVSHRLSQVSLYTYTLFINRPIWGYQQAVFYFQEGTYQTPKPLNELANLFGVKYVVLDSEEDPVYKYQESGWEFFDQRDRFQIWRNPGAPELAELTSRPKVLVIGDSQRAAAYEQILRLANLGGLSWQEAYLVQGRKDIDFYSPGELERFEALILHGYSYKSKEKAWGLMKDYVEKGGSLFVETGWQYKAADWETEEAPPILPFTSLSWQNLGQTKAFILSQDWQDKIKVAEFDPLVWENKGWGFSSFNQENLQNWGEIMLSVKDQPLVVRGEKGQGKIVWSGMNLPAHAIRNQNAEEIKFFHALVTWLLAGKEEHDYSLSVNRSTPDKIEFTLNQETTEPTSLFWRESYHPHWQAKIGEQPVKVDEVGPSLMLIRLPSVSAGTKVTLEYQMPFSYWLVRLISLLTFAILIFFAFSKGARERLKIASHRLTERSFSRIKESWEKEDY